MAFFSEITRSRPLLLIGAGHMGGALLKVWIKGGLGQDAVIIVDPKGEQEIRKNLGLEQLQVCERLDQIGNIPPPSVVVFAVKPQFMADVFALTGHIPLDQTLVISIAAGVRIEVFEKHLRRGTPIIRAMPNTPAAIAKGISAVIGNDAAGDADLRFAKGLLGYAGKVVQVSSEDALDAVTALSGSGPAYFYYMVEALAAAGIEAGLDSEAAIALARETFIGAAGLMEASGEDAAELRRRVTSPGGTTEAALSVLMADQGLQKLMTEAVLKAKARGREL